MSESGFLHRYFLENASKQSDKWIHYLSVYERHFSRFRGKQPTILEIGVQGGGSLQMWRQYFGEGCKIIGLDIDPVCKNHESTDVEVFIGSQDDPNVINSIFEKYPNIDIVIDDGSHISKHMISSFELIYNKVNPNGVYLVEDTHCCYMPDFGSYFKYEKSFIEFAKNKVDELNAYWYDNAKHINEFTRSTNYIAMYDSIVVFEKKPQGTRKRLITLPMGQTQTHTPPENNV